MASKVPIQWRSQSSHDILNKMLTTGLRGLAFILSPFVLVITQFQICLTSNSSKSLVNHIFTVISIEILSAIKIKLYLYMVRIRLDLLFYGSYGIGNRGSGRDIALDIANKAKKVYISGRRWAEGDDFSKPFGSKPNIALCASLHHCPAEGTVQLLVKNIPK